MVVQKGAYTDGELVLFFPVDGQLSHEVCHHNNLYRENHGVNKDPQVFGYFDATRRVKSIRLRGEQSQGFMLRPECLDFLGKFDLKQGQFVSEINGHTICEKYVTKATAARRAGGSSKTRPDIVNFNKIGSTSNARYGLAGIPAGAVITVTEKIDATSGRTGKIYRPINLPKPVWWKRWLYKLMKENPVLSIPFYQLVSGTRKTIICEGKATPVLKPDGTEIPLGPRQQVHNQFLGCLHENESVYYELVVVAPSGQSAFNRAVKDKNLRKQFGSRMNFTYGVEPGTHDFWIYKITRQTNDGEAVPLSAGAMRQRAEQLGMKTVPVLDQFIYDGNPKALVARLKTLSEGLSVLDSRHIREGVCIQIDSPKIQQVMKFKSDTFLQMESDQKEDPDYIDPEEIS